MAPNEPAAAIGIDIGTSGVRAVALSQQGDVVGFTARPFADITETRSPAAWWEGVHTCLTRLATECSLSEVRGIAVDGTSGTVLATDRAGAPVGDLLMYNEPCPDASIVERIAREAPLESPARGANSGLARAVHLSRQAGASLAMHQADWVLLQLGLSKPATDENNALKTGYDLSTSAWPAWIEAAGLAIDTLPTVYRAGEPVETVGGFAASIGISPSCRLHAGTTDGCASFLATGASETGDGVTALGSTMVLKLASDRPINAPEYGVYSHRVLDFWLVGGASNSGGAVIRALFGDDRMAQLTENLDPDRPTGLGYYPLLKPGERFPINDPSYPPRLEPRPIDDVVFFQGVLEGMTEIERLGYARLNDLGAARLRTVRTVGGGAKNPVWTEMRHRALNIDFLPSQSSEAAVGTASLVLSGGGR
jgi:sugar (pentulose or hexulose) kinase